MFLHFFLQDHPDLKVSKMTQEIGFVQSRSGEDLEYEKFPIGSILYLYPYHSCATAGMYPVSED